MAGPRQRKRANGEASQERILDAATEIASERGYVPIESRGIASGAARPNATKRERQGGVTPPDAQASSERNSPACLTLTGTPPIREGIFALTWDGSFFT